MLTIAIIVTGIYITSCFIALFNDSECDFCDVTPHFSPVFPKSLTGWNSENSDDDDSSDTDADLPALEATNNLSDSDHESVEQTADDSNSEVALIEKLCVGPAEADFQLIENDTNISTPVNVSTWQDWFKEQFPTIFGIQ